MSSRITNPIRWLLLQLFCQAEDGLSTTGCTRIRLHRGPHRAEISGTGYVIEWGRSHEQ